MKTFKGSGGLFGGGSSSSQPTDTADTLRSDDRVELILGLCQGPIKGLTNGNQSFYIGSTAYQNADGTNNFNLFDLSIYPGDTPAQPIIPVLGGFEDFRTPSGLFIADGTTVPVESLLQANVEQSFTTQASAVSQLILRLQITQLYRSGTDLQLASIPGNSNTFSNFLPNSFQVQVEYANTSGVRVNPFNGPLTISGKTQVGEPHEIRFIPQGQGPFQVFVTNLTFADQVTSWVNFYVAGYFEVTGGVFGTARGTTVDTAIATDGSATPVIRTTQPPNQRPDGTIGIDMIALRITVTQLLVSNSSGTNVDSVNLSITYKPTSSTTWSNPFGGDVTISGKATSPFVEDYRWPVDPINGTYDIQVVCTTPPATDHYRTLSWESIQEIIGGPMAYDGLAVAYLIGQSTDAFSSIPDISGVYDLLLCHLPTNYDPYARTYTGTWDGTFKMDWTSNPAWCLYELAMNATWGAVSYWPHLNINKYDAYAAGVWCDGLVSDGAGGQQPRYTYNGLISSARGIRDQLRYMAGVFNGTFLDDMNGNTRIVFDSNEDAVAIFTSENVVEGLFNYTYTDPAVRYNYITGSYDDPNLNYQTVPLVVQSASDIARYGQTTTEIALVGCTNAHEALRRLTYKLIAATTETEVISFSTNRLGLMIRPFNVILVSDADVGRSVSGRIKDIDVTRTVIYFRDLTVMELGVTYTFSTHHANPDYPINSTDPLALVQIPFTAPFTGGTYAIEISSPLPVDVAPDAPFSIGGVDTLLSVPKAYRVTAIETQNGNSDAITITAIEVNRNKMVLADTVQTAVGFDFMNLPIDISPITGLEVFTTTVDVNGTAIANVSAIWIPSTDPRVTSYQVQYRKTGDTEWTPARTTVTPRADIFDVPDGIYDFGVRAMALTSATSVWVYSYAVAAGLDVPPDDVSFITGVQSGTNLNLNWTPVQAADLSFYWLRYSPLTDETAVWEFATDLIQETTSTSAVVTALAGTYFVKAVDTSDVASVNAASVIVSSVITSLIVVDDIQQAPTWPGTQTNCSVNGFGVLVTSLAGGNTVGTYEWQTTDLGASYNCTLSVSLLASATNLGVHMSDWTTLAGVDPISGVKASDFQIDIFISVSPDGTNFGPYQPFATGQWTGEQFQFKVVMTSKTANVAPELISCAASVSMLERTVRGTTVFVPAIGLSVVFDPVFHVTPTIIPSIQNAQSGDYFSLTGVTSAGFTINCFDSTNTAAQRFISYIVVGFGVS